jgi:hypothetical protein
LSNATRGELNIAMLQDDVRSLDTWNEGKARVVLEVGSEASTDTALLRWRVHGDEDEVGLTNALVDVSREEKVAAASLLDNIDEARLIDGQVKVWTVPRVDAGLVKVNDSNLDLGALECDYRAGRAAYADASATLHDATKNMKVVAHRRSQHRLMVGWAMSTGCHDALIT